MCATCAPPKPDPLAQPECPETPIVLDLGRRGFQFTDGLNGVSFDLDADGSVDQSAWTAPEGRDGFLTLDRNDNGVIDDGGELFGNNTPQPPSEEPNGFEALAIFDLPESGGNRDGRISADDSVFADLRVWVDWSHDGYSDAAELYNMSEAGVSAISLSYFKSRRRDRHGNELKFLTRFLTDDHRQRWATDVYFVAYD
jgi:hypothetical protein